MNVAAVVKESTDARTNTHLYVSRLGLSGLNENKHPLKSGKPVFSAPVLQSFWNETEARVKELAHSYGSRKGMQEALGVRPTPATDIVEGILNIFGSQIWNQGGCSVPFIAELDEKHYPEHLVYQDQQHKEKYVYPLWTFKGLRTNILPSRIRLHVLGWILQRACRRAEDSRRTLTVGKRQKRRRKSLRKSFSEIIRIRTPYPSDSEDELAARTSSPEIMLVHRRDTAQAARASKSTPSTSTVSCPPGSSIRKATAVMIPGPGSKENRVTVSAVEKRRKKTAEKGITLGNAMQTQGQKRGLARKTQPVPDADGATHSRSSIQQAPSASNAVSNTEDSRLKRDRQDLASGVFLLKDSKPGEYELTKLDQVISLIKTIIQKDAPQIRAACGTEYERYRGALDKWLGCSQVKSEFCAATGYKGDGSRKEDYLSRLEPETRKRLRQTVFFKAEEIDEWSQDSALTSTQFATEVASILLTMTDWRGLGMRLEDLAGDLRTFNMLLSDWFIKTE